MTDELKLFDFNAKGRLCGTIGWPMNIGWPCVAYRVTLPKQGKAIEREFNIFEYCILKLLAFKRYEIGELAEETCLPPDLVELIVLRLQDRAKIDGQLRLLPGVQEAIESQDAESELKAEDYETCVIFRECVGGRLLPMLVDANMRCEEFNEENQTFGKSHVEIRPIAALSGEQTLPSPADIVIALRTMARRRRASGDSYRIPRADCVSIAEKGELCRLRVRVVMQWNGNWRIVNPFGTGWSPELETSYQEDLKKRDDSVGKREFIAWQHRNARTVQHPSAPNKESEPFETPENYRRYPELIAALKRRDCRDHEGGPVDVYAVLEWTLYYALKESDTKRIVQLLGVMSREDSQRRLIEALPDDLWGDVTVRRLFTVPTPGLLQQFVDGGAKMQTVLPLALFASEDDPESAFSRMFAEHPAFLTWIAELKDRRDPMRHGKSRWSEIYDADDMARMKTVVGLFFPSVRFSAAKPGIPAINSVERPVDDERISARIAVQDAFGVSNFIRFDTILQDALVKVEMFRSTHTGGEGEFDAHDGVNDLYKSVQSAFRPLLIGDRSGPGTVAYAEARALRAGFGTLPPALRTVRESMLRLTLNGNDQTLQSCAVAWLILSEDDVLGRVAARMPSLLADIDRLICIDGHGNQRIPMTAKEFDLLCKEVFNIIRTLTEV